MPRFRLNRRTFIAPRIYEAGSIINYSGPVGPQFEALDEEGAAMLEAYHKEHPNAALHFTQRLRIRGGVAGDIEPATAELVEAPAPDEPGELSTLANPGKKQAGLADGGKVAPEVVAPVAEKEPSKDDPKKEPPPK